MTLERNEILRISVYAHGNGQLTKITDNRTFFEHSNVFISEDTEEALKLISELAAKGAKRIINGDETK